MLLCVFIISTLFFFSFFFCNLFISEIKIFFFLFRCVCMLLMTFRLPSSLLRLCVKKVFHFPLLITIHFFQSENECAAHHNDNDEKKMYKFYTKKKNLKHFLFRITFFFSRYLILVNAVKSHEKSAKWTLSMRNGYKYTDFVIILMH